jgi:hypothetical protein
MLVLSEIMGPYPFPNRGSFEQRDWTNECLLFYIYIYIYISNKKNGERKKKSLTHLEDFYLGSATHYNYLSDRVLIFYFLFI